MRSFSKLKWLGSLLANQKTQPSAARTTHARLKLSIEQLESRVTPAVTVSGNNTTVDYTNTNDTIVLSTDANDPTKLVLDAAFSEDYSIAKPTGSLTLNLGGANLVVNTTNLGSASLIVNSAEKATVSGNLSAGNIYIGAQNEIDVSDGANLLGQTIRTSAYAGTGGLTFRLNTIVRPFGQSWSDDGFFPGEVITIGNTNSRDLDKDGKPDNDGQYVVTGVSGSTLTVDPSKTFASEYQVTGASITGVGGNVALSVDAAFNLSFDAAAPVVRDREAAGKIAIGNAHLNGNNVFVLSNSNTQKFADFEVNTFGLDQVNLPASMTSNTFPVFVDNLINPQTGQTVPDTIVRPDGNWLAEGFRAGDYIQVSNSQLNDGIYRIAALNESTLTLDASAQLKPENGTSALTIETVNLMTGDPSLDFVTDPTTGVTRIHRNDGVTWASQGFEKGQTLSVKNTPDGPDADTEGDNDGEYPIMDVNGADLILDLGNTVPGSTSDNSGLKLVSQSGVHGAVITSQGSGADIPLARLDETVVVQPANVQLTFADNGNQPDTITRATGVWSDEHFGVGQSILVKGTRFNDNTFRIAAISSDGKTLTLSSDDALVNETIVTGSDTEIQSLAALTADEGQDPPTLVFNPANNSITRKDTRTWRQDGFQAGQTINVNGTASNDGPNQIASISADGKTLFMASFINMFEDTEATPPPGVVDVVATGALAKPELSFTGNTITRSSGSWSDDGFTAGGKINIDGSADNNGQFTVTSITNNGRTLVIDLGTKPDNTPIVFADEHTLTATVQGLILLTKSNGVAFTAGDLAGGLLLRMSGISDMLSGFIAQATTQQSTSEITVADGATLNATQDLGLRSVAQSTLNAKIQSLWLGVSYGKSEATSRLIVGDNTKITAGDTVGLNADVFNTLYVGNKITTGANFPLLAAQRVVLDKAKLIPGPAFTAAAGEASSVSETRIGGPNSFISGSIVNVSAKNLNDFTVETKGKVNGIAVPNTGGAAAIIVSKTSSSADATLSGTVHATGQLNLDSRSVNVNDDASGTASVKRDLFGSNDGSFAAAQKAKVASALASKGFDLKGTADAGKVSGAAALTIANSTNEASSLVTGDARLYSKGDVSVTSYAEENFNASAIAAAKANSTVALAGAIIISNYDNESNATVADGAVISAAQNLNVHADSVVPNQDTLDDAIKGLAQPPGIQSLPTVNIDDSDPFKASQSAQQGSTDLTGWSQDNLADNMAYLQASILPLVKFSRWVPDFLASTDASASAGEIEKEAAFGPDGKPIQKDSVKGKVGLDPETRVVSQADYAISGTVKVHQVHNTAHATVGEGVKLNINLSDLNPATPFVVSPADTQKISVTANTSFESIDVAGIAKLGLNKSEGGSVIGGSYSGITLTNEAIAYVDDGAQLKAKGDIEVKAANRNWDLAIGQQGGKASVVGVNGAVTIYRIDNNVQAYIEDQAKVDSGGTLTVNANDDVRLLNVNAVMQDGGVLAVGIGVSINSLEHTTHAFIGNLNPATNSFPSAGSIHAAKAVDVNADSETKLLGIGLAKTAVKGEEPDDLPKDENGEKKPVPLKASKLLGVDDTTQQGNAPQFGLGISANVALNFQKDDTQAFIRGSDQADGTKHQVQVDPGGVVSVTAESNVFAIAVTASILTGSEIAPAGALSGAFTWNSTSGDELDNPDDNTQPRINRAYIADTTVTADQVKVNANTNDFSVSVTAGVGAVKPTYVANIAGSGTVSVNDSQTESFIGDPTDSPTAAKTIIRTTGDVDVEAKSDNFLVSVTGAVTVSGKVAVGAALDVGLFDNAVNAYIGGDADVKSFNPSAGSTPGNVTVHAESDQTITTVGAAVSLLASTLALPFTINTQNFNSNVTSYIGAGAIVSVPNVYVTADEDLRVTSVSGTAAFGASKAGVGLAFGLVDVERNVQATVNPGTVVTANGTDGLKVLSNGVEKIVNAVASGTGGQQISATVSPAFTQLAGAVKSTIVGSNVTASGVDVDANSAPLIFNLAIAGSVAVAKGPESGPPPSPGDAAKAEGQPFRPLPITFAGAGAGSGAYIRNDVQALVINSTINATGEVSVAGHDHSSIYADAGGLALAFRLGSQASGSGVNGTIGASVAINDVQSNTHALIQNSTVNAHDDVHLLADSSPKIQALTVAGAGTVSSGGDGFNVNFAGAGAGSGNNVKNAVDALIAGSNVTSTAADVILEAYDKSTIHSDAGAVAVSLSLAQAGKANVNMSVGASAAVNQVRNAIQAAVEPFAGVNSNVTAAGDVSLTSQSTSKIDTLSIAGALSATIAGSGGGVGANFAGAGTGSANDIANTIDASITGGTTMAQQGKLTIDASDDSTIHADAGAVAVALSIASQNRVGVQGSVGASIGVNDISNTTTATAANASIQANGDVSLTADEDAAIDAVTIAGAGSVAAGTGTVGVSFAGAGAGSANQISNTTKATLSSDSHVASTTGELNLSSSDDSTITANSTGAALAVSAGSQNSAAITVGVAVALNDIHNTIQSVINGSNDVSSHQSTKVTSDDSAKIDSVAVAATLSVAAGAQNGVAVSGGGAVTKNTIGNTNTATIKDSTLVSGGGVTVSAQNDSADSAKVASVSVAAAFGANGAAGVAVGIGVATNDIANTVAGIIDHSTVNSGGPVAVSSTESSNINALTIGAAVAVGGGGAAGVGVGAAGAGSGITVKNTVQALIQKGATVTTTSGDVTLSATDSASITANGGGVGVGVGAGGSGGGVGASLGVSFATNDIEDTVQAIADQSNVTSAGQVGLTTNETATIQALTIGGAVAVGAGGGGGVGVAVAGAGSFNTVKNIVQSQINGDAHSVKANNGAVTLQANDTSSITANAGGVGLAVGAAGGGGVGVTVGFSAASNSIANQVLAVINSGSVNATNGVSLASNEAATINALTVGGALAVGAGGAGGVGVGGAGAGSGNTVKNTVQASILGQAAVITNGGDVSMTAKDQSGITADGGGISVGVAAGTGGGVGASLGVGYANNDIRNTVRAFVDNSDVTSAGKVVMSADENATIKALSIAGTVAVGAGTGGVAAAGAGAGSYNSVHDTVQADVANGAGKTVAANGGSVTISATDHSTINASAGGVAAGVGAGGAVGVGVTVGASTVNNDVGNQVQAFVDGALVKAAGGDVSLNAAETTNISGLAVGGAASGSGGVLAGVSASGAGAEVDNNIANNVAAYATNGATLKTTGSGNVSILASDSSTADAKAIAGALAAGFSIGGSGAIAIGASIASNTFNSTTQAYGDSSTVSSAGGVTVQATSASSGTTLGVAASVAVAGAPAGLSFSGGGASSTNRVTNTVKSFVDGGVITAAGDVLISSLETSPLSAKVGTGAIAGGLVAASVSVSAADNSSASQVQSTVNNATVTTPGNVRINSSTGGTADTLAIATSVAVGLGGAGAGATASSNLGDSVEASTGFNATINAGQDVEIAADSNQTGNASTDGIAVGAIAVGVSIAHALMQGAVKAKAEGQTKSGKNLKIRGTSEGASAATAKALVGGIYVGYGSEAIASNSPAITSTLTGTTQAGGDVTVEAVAQPKASAESKGISASGITIGLSTSQSTVAPTVAATGGGQITVPNGGLTVNALVGGLSNSAHSNASGGAILATINGAQSDAVSGPVVSANLGSGAQITTGKDVNVTANSTGSTTAKTDGLNIGGFVAASRNVANAAIGTATLDGIVSVPSMPASTSAFAGDQANVNSGGSLTITANNSQKATSNATGSIGGLIAIGGAQATTVRNNPVSANAQQNSSLNADRNVTITATNGYDPAGTALGIAIYSDNLAAVANNTFGGLGASGKPTASTTVADGTDAELGDHAQVNARKGSFTLQAITKDFGVRSSATAKGGGAVAVPIANATTTTNDPATVTVGSAAGVKAGMNILVESRIGVNDSSDSTTSGKGLGVDSTATSKTSGTANASTLIKDHANLAAGLNMQILADQKDGVLSSSTATATGGAAGLHVAGTTTIDKTNTSNVDVQPSATLNAVGSLQLDAATGPSSGSLADLFVFGTTSHAITDAGGFAGKTDANSTTNLTTQANVNVEKAPAGSTTTTMRTSNLQVTSHNNSLPVTTKAERKGFVLIDVGSSKKKETVTAASSVAMYANATITGASGYLHIDPTGNVTSSGVTYTTVGNQIILDPIVNPGNGSALISAKGGVTGIQGNSTFTFDQGSGSVDLLNEDPTKDLVVGDISVLNSHTTPKLTIDALFLPPGSSFTTNISNVGGTPVNITSVSNVVLRGMINNAEGSVTVNAPNGSITGAGNQLISSQQVTLAGNSIGTAATRLNVQTVQWNGAPVLSANATGNIYLNLSATNMQNTDPVAVNNATFNAPLVDLLIADSGAGSVYSLGVTTGELNVDAGVSTPVDLSITATGDLPVGSVISRRGNVRLTAGGAIITKRPGGATDLIGNNLTLVAGTTIGAASPLTIVSAFTAPGIVNATAAGDINLRQVTGNLSLNQVKSATGNISLQSAGRLIDGRSGAGSPPDAVEAPAGKAILSAGLGIGSQTQNLVTKVAYLEAEAGLGELFVNNIGINLIIGGGGAIAGVNGATVNVVTAGDLTVNENSVASGLIAMTAGSITVSGGVAVRSDNSSVTLSASGGLEITANSHVAAGGEIVLRSTGNGDFNLLNINGFLSGSSVQIITGSGTGDAIYFNQVPVGIPVTVDGGAGNLDTLDITGTNGDDTYAVTGNTITLSNGTSFTYSNIEQIRIHSLAGNDTFNVSGSSASVTTQLLAGGRSTLNLTTNGVLNALVDYQGGTGPNVVNVTTNSIPTGSGNPNVLVADSGQINGLGLQATLAHVTALNVNLNNDGTQFHLMGSQAPTVVQANGHNQKILLGGDPVPVPVLSGGTAILKDFGESGNINAFAKSVTLNSVAGSGNTLDIDNSEGTATQAVLTANAVKGLGEAQGAELKFNGIDSLDLSAGQGDLTVKNTISGPVAIDMAANSEAQPGTLTVLSSAASTLTLSGGGNHNNVVFDASGQTTPITAALTDGAAAGSSKLGGFGPISPTTFAGFTEADLLEGSNSDTLSLSSSVPTTLIHVNGGMGSDQFIVGRVAVSPDSLTMPNTMILSGDSGDDKVNVIVSGNPGDSINQGLLYLSSAVEHMEVDNSANPNPVNWTTNSGATVGYVVNNVETPLVEMSLVDDVNIIGGTSPQNTLNVNAGGTAQKGTINGNQVTLQSSGLLQFTRLQGTVASYVEGGFTLRSTTMDNQPNLEADRSILPAIKAANPAANAPVVFTATDGGLFSLYSIDFSGTGTTTLIGTTATGKTVTQQITVSSPGAFQTVTLDPKFSELTSVSLVLGSLSMTKLVAIQTLHTGIELPIAAVPGTMPNAPQNIEIGSGPGSISVDGHGIPIYAEDYLGYPIYFFGVLNGTPFAITNNFLDNNAINTIYFYGDLNIPAGSTVTIGSNQPVGFVVQNDVNIGDGVTFNVPPGLNPASQGGQQGTAFYTSGHAGGGGSANVFGLGSNGLLDNRPGEDGGAGFYGFQGQNAATTYNSADWRTAQGGLGGGGYPNGSGGFSFGGSGGSGGSWGPSRENADGSPLFGVGEDGGDGLDGGNGQNGTAGLPGLPGQTGFVSSSNDLVLKSGGGGGGGGAGAAGGGGGGGGAGGNGGNGGAVKTDPTYNIYQMVYGGDGGDGGAGGNAGDGGLGGNGGNGGAGGGGFAIRAGGRINLHATAFSARGTDGQAGQLGTPGTTGMAGQPGGAGTSGQSLDSYGYPDSHSGAGGHGGHGGSGGDGGDGGNGGFGGGGGGGSVQLFGTAVYADSGTKIDVSGGLNGDGSAGNGGRFQFGSNTNTVNPSLTGVGNTYQAATGTVGQNLYIAGTPNTPLIAGLTGGAAAYGLVGDPTLLAALAADPTLTQTISSAPENAIASVTRQPMPAGFDQYAGYDLVVFANLTDIALPSPKLGITTGSADPTFQRDLQYDGLFHGGIGEPSYHDFLVNFQSESDSAKIFYQQNQPVPPHDGLDARPVRTPYESEKLGAIPAHGFYVTLVPHTDPTGGQFVNASIAGETQNVSGASLADGQAHYIELPDMPAPADSGIRNYTVKFSSMNALGISATGAASNVFNELGSPNVSQLAINLQANSGSNQVNLIDSPTAGSSPMAQAINVLTGDGNDQVSVYAAQPNHVFSIDTGAGADTFLLDGDASQNAGDTFTVQLGAGNDTAQVTGANLSATQTINIDAGADNDTLVYDSAQSPITPAAPTLPNGNVTIQGTPAATINFQNLENLPGFAAPTFDIGGAYVINQGQSLTLHGTATAATNTQILSIDWDLDGDGAYNDAIDSSATTGLTASSNPVLSWSQLRALSLGSAGTYSIGMKVTTTVGVTYAHTTLRIDKAAPTLTLNAPAAANVGEPYTITFGAGFVGGETPTSFTVTWGDGTNTVLPGDATSASHTYLTTGDEQVQVGVTQGGNDYSTNSQSVSVSVDPNSLSLDGPYEIDAGSDLTLKVTANGAPSSALLDLLGQGTYNDASASFVSNGDGTSTATLTLTWAQLQAAGITGAGAFNAVSVKALYGSEVPGGFLVSTPVSLTVNDVAPTATFTGSATEGTSGSVSFANQSHPSTAQIAAGFLYSYDVGNTGTFQVTDSNSPTFALPTDSLEQTGPLVVRGRIATPSGAFTDYVITVSVADQSPQFVTIDGDTNVFANTPFSLSNVTFSDPGNDLVTANVNWGDGTSSSGQITTTNTATAPTTGVVTASHIFAYQADPYTVTVTLRDSAGLTTSRTFKVTVLDPTLSSVTAGPDQTVDEGGLVQLTGASFLDPSAPSTYTATVNWGDGTPVNVSPAISSPGGPLDLGRIFDSHRYGGDGTYTVTVSVAKTGQTPASSTFKVTVNNVAPAVDAGMDIDGGLGQPVVVSGTFSDPAFTNGGAGETYSATINWGDGVSEPGSITLTAGSAGNPATGTIHGTHQYSSDGPHTVTVSVNDGTATGSDSFTVNNAVPVITVGGSLSGNQGDPVSLQATFSDTGFDFGGGTKSFTATIEWGDGTTSNGVVTVTPGNAMTPTTGTITGNHAYETFGDFPVVVRLKDEVGTEGSVNLQAAINNLAPTVAALPAGGFVPGRTFVLTGHFGDPGLGDTHAVSIDWGDGTTSDFDGDTQVVDENLNPVVSFVEPTATQTGLYRMGHVYSDNLEHTVTVTVTDNGGLSSQASRTYASRPGLIGLTPPDNIKEGEVFSGPVATFFEPGHSATDFTAKILWGDGKSTTVSGSDGGITQNVDGTFTVNGSHVYADNGTNLTFEVDITETASGNQDSQTASFNILNADPVVTGLTNNSPDVGGVFAGKGQPVTLSASFTDPGVLDTHTVSINWGDGITTAGMVTETGGRGTLSGSHLYTTGGVYDVTVTLTDKDGGTSVTHTTATVGGVGLHNGQLQIIGTNNRDIISAYLRKTAAGSSLIVDARFNIVKTVVPITRYTFKLSDVTSILILGGAANDDLRVNALLTMPTTINGGAGNDYIWSGGGNDTIIDLLGNNQIRTGLGDDNVTVGNGANRILTEQGNDVVIAGDGKNVIYLGDGNDRLTAGNGGNTVYAGTGNDSVITGSGRDAISGDTGNDVIRSGDGNDVVHGGTGNDLLVGGDGNDSLYGDDGQDVLIGGIGADLLIGGSQDDLLIAGSTIFDNDPDSLNSILAEWSGPSSYANRIAHLSGLAGGLNGSVFLSGSDQTGGRGNQTVFDDTSIDRLYGDLPAVLVPIGDRRFGLTTLVIPGRPGSDWYLANTDLDNNKVKDTITGKTTLEVSTDIDLDKL